MRLDNVDLNLFVVFDALYQERSVTKVAQSLNLTQPGVSNALSRLRQAFDDPLFVRSPDGMLPTPVADSIVGDIRKALALLRRSFGATARFDPTTTEKTFRLAMNDLVEKMLLPSLQCQIQTLAPNARLTSFYSDSRAATEDLKANVIDLIIDSAQVNAKEFGAELVAQLPHKVLCRPNHPLLAKVAGSGKISMKEYLQAQHIHVSSRRKGRGQADIGLHSAGYKREINTRVRTYAVAETLLLQTDLLWTAPSVIADYGDLIALSLPFSVEALKLYLYWPKSAEDDPASQWLRELVRAAFKTELAKQH